MSFTKSAILAAIAAVPALVSAHGHVTQIAVNGKVIPGFQPGNPSTDSVGWATTVTDNGFVLADALSSPDIVCHRGATPAANSAKVAAGDTITITWDTWPKSHVGPIIDYLAPCGNDCSTVTKTNLEFFKIQEGGLLDGASAPGRWVTDELIEDGFTWKTTIPPSVAPGLYVLRHEIIALHEGNQANKAQLYPQCINLEITGSGSAKPAGVVATSLYTAQDPGIFFNPYTSNLKYTIPGPANSFAGGSSPAPPASSASAAPPASSATAAPPANSPSASPANPPSNTAPASPPANSAPAKPSTTLATQTRPADGGCSPTRTPSNGGSVNGNALYQQCGGMNFSGSKTCAQGTCKEMNPYYSQCVPN